MSKYIFLPLLSALLLGSIAIAQAAEELLPEQLQKIESLQRRADKLAFGELGTDNYHLAKARTWLDLALSEYHENEANGFVTSAIVQAETLLDALEKKQTNISMDTPAQVNGSEPVRPDLWNKIAALKKHEKFSCGQRPVAEAEVLLVWAGHEKLESSWAHAEPYAHSAEDLLKEALTSINDCVARVPAIEKIALSSDALFEFGSAELEPSALWRLNRLADSIKQETKVEEVELVGHTDRLRSDGNQERNQLLSEQRAGSIRQYLIDKGIPADKIHASGAGSSQPLVQCASSESKAKQVACLKPNRRVEIILRGSR
jgi:outer membrane protein OmpA-like peptidoglycan-associated protein